MYSTQTAYAKILTIKPEFLFNRLPENHTLEAYLYLFKKEVERLEIMLTDYEQ